MSSPFLTVKLMSSKVGVMESLSHENSPPLMESTWKKTKHT